ncbi:MAG TPA: PDZ domain-containing protein, partial [Microbacteriaceae bacterium]|nr:PDZ domain-containing protein [Microbacteriaceae bacterium]
ALIDGGSADESGLRVGDLITRLGARSAPTVVTLAEVTVRAAPGDVVEVEYIREREVRTTTVTLRPDPVPHSRP